MSSLTLAKFGRFDMFDARSLIYFMRVKLGRQENITGAI